MLTNRINVTYNIENIDADFDIFRVEKSNKDYYKYNILDSAVYEFKAAAVQWTFGATALVLFRKGEVTEKQFKESIMKEYEDVKIQKIATVYKGNIIKNLIMDCQSYTKYRPNETTGGIFVSWRRKEELPTGA